MEPLEPPDTFCLSAAVGWLGLGNPAEAEAELAQISEAFQTHPDVLELRWMICAEQKQWDKGLELARALIEVAPERSSAWLHQAYAARRASSGSLQQAWEALLPAFEKFPDEPTIAYNLSCYACQMEKLDAARVWLKKAMSIGGKEKMRAMALADADLKPLWNEIRSY